MARRRVDARRVAAAAMMASALVYTVHGQGLPGVRPRQRRHHAAGGLLRARRRRQSRRRPAHGGGAPTAICTSRCMTSGGRGQPETGGGAVALRDANNDGKFEVVERFGSGSTTGIAHPQRLRLSGAPAGHRALQAHRRHVEADRRRRDDRHRPARRAAARGQGHCLRRPRRPLHQRRRAVERLPGSGSPARREGRGPVPDPREARRASGSSTRTSRTRRRHRARGSPPACARCRPSPGTTTRSTSR